MFLNNLIFKNKFKIDNETIFDNLQDIKQIIEEEKKIKEKKLEEEEFTPLEIILIDVLKNASKEFITQKITEPSKEKNNFDILNNLEKETNEIENILNNSPKDIQPKLMEQVFMNNDSFKINKDIKKRRRRRRKSQNIKVKKSNYEEEVNEQSKQEEVNEQSKQEEVNEQSKQEEVKEEVKVEEVKEEVKVEEVKEEVKVEEVKEEVKVEEVKEESKEEVKEEVEEVKEESKSNTYFDDGILNKYKNLCKEKNEIQDTLLKLADEEKKITYEDDYDYDKDDEDKNLNEFITIENKIYNHLKIIISTKSINSNNIVYILTELMKFIEIFKIKGVDKKTIILATLKKFLIDENYKEEEIDFIINKICNEFIDILISIDKRKITIKKKFSCFIPWCN
jgi:hypothetical protein